MSSVPEDSREAIGQAVEMAQLARPALSAFTEKLRARLEAAAGAHAIEALRAGDLLLAEACAEGDPYAISLLDRECISKIDRVIGHMRLPAQTVDEIKQTVRTKLLVAPAPGGRARIAEYQGRGALDNWIGVIATREAMGLLRAKKTNDGDEALVAMESPVTGPELGYLKQHYRAAFSAAFADAMAELSAPSRNALRMHYLHGLGIDRLAQLYGVHRSNAARRIAKARDQLLSATRRRLVIALNVDRVEIDSVMRLVEGRLDVSVQRLLESRSE